MKKVVFLLLAMICAGVSFGQQKQRIAVYVTGGQQDGDNEVLTGMLTEAITKSADYVAVERTADFLQQLRKEQIYQRSGNVDDQDIARLGKEAGAKYVCVAELMPVQGGDFITARLIDVEKASIVAVAEGSDQITSLQILVNMSETIARQLIADVASGSEGKPRERVAVYVSGNDADNVNKTVGAKLVSALSKSNKYVAMERTDAFLKQLSSEAVYQRSGNVDDDQIAKLGKQLGVEYVCAAKISSSSYGGSFVRVSLINSETAEVKATGNAQLTNTDINSIASTTRDIAAQLVGTEDIIASGTTANVFGKDGDLTWTLTKDGVLTITGVGEIPKYKYANCELWHSYIKDITEVYIDYGVTSIGNYAFKGAEKLEKVSIPGSVIRIGEWAFFGCSLKVVDIPNSVVNIENGIFRDNKKLTAINVGLGNKEYTSVDGVLYNKAMTEILQYPIGRSDTYYEIAPTVRTIREFAFERCNLIGVKLPKYLDKIELCAFSRCEVLNEINLECPRLGIESFAFNECKNLKKIEIRCGIPTAYNNTFSGINPNCELIVPKDQVADYKKAEGWKEIKNIKASD